MTDQPKIFDIREDLEAYFKANGYTFNEEIISEQSRGELVAMNGKVIEPPEVKRKAVLNIFKNEQAIGRVELDETRKTEPAITLRMYGGNSHSHWFVPDPNVIVQWTSSRCGAGAITPDEAGCFFVALAGYSHAKATANAAARSNTYAELEALGLHEGPQIDYSAERINAGVYANAAIACLKHQRVPWNMNEASQMASDTPTTTLTSPVDSDDHLSRQDIEVEGFSR